MKQPVAVSLSSFGADTVRHCGQASYFEQVAQAGATHIELREELLEPSPDLSAYAALATRHQLKLVYSSTLELWQAGTPAPNPALPDVLGQAHAAGAIWLKVSLGHFTPQADFTALVTLLAESPVHLLVENDQTVQGGRIEPLVEFFAGAKARSVPVGMTFDIGNWLWQGQSVLGAADQLGHRVEYLHCKAVRLNAAGKLIALPPQACDLDAWFDLLGRFPKGITRAIEYPLQGEDLAAEVARRVTELAMLHTEEARAHA